MGKTNYPKRVAISPQIPIGLKPRWSVPVPWMLGGGGGGGGLRHDNRRITRMRKNIELSESTISKTLTSIEDGFKKMQAAMEKQRKVNSGEKSGVVVIEKALEQFRVERLNKRRTKRTSQICSGTVPGRLALGSVRRHSARQHKRIAGPQVQKIRKRHQSTRERRMVQHQWNGPKQ